MMVDNVEPKKSSGILYKILMVVSGGLFYYLVKFIIGGTMSIAFVLYMISFLDALSIVILCIIFLCLLITILATIFILSEGEIAVTVKEYKGIIKGFVIFNFVIAIMFSMIPSKNDMYLIASVHVGENIIKSEKVNELLDKSYMVLIGKLDDMIDKKKPVKTKEKE